MKGLLAALAAVTCFVVPANAQEQQNPGVMIPGPAMRCVPKDGFLEGLKKKYNEVRHYSGTTPTSKAEFEIYLNLDTGTGTYVEFRVPGFACYVALSGVVIPKAGDL